MNPRTWSSLLLGLVLLTLPAGATDAPPFVPDGLPQQGRLLDSNDQPVTGKVDMTFNLYHQATGGTPVWSEEQTVSVEAGYYAIVLGDPADTGVQPITTDELAGPAWIGVTIGGNEMQPRLQLGTVPYAERADLANRMLGGTIDGATITNSSVDATSVSVGGHTVIDSSGNVNATSLSIGGNTVIDSSGNIGGKPLSDYVTNDSLTQNYSTSADLAGQGYDNLVRNGSFELGQAGAMPTYWDAVGTGAGSRMQKADAGAPFGAKVLEVVNNDQTGQVAVRQVVLPAGSMATYAGATFTASVYAKKVSGPQGRSGRLCLVESDSDPSPTCVALTMDNAYARATVSHTVSATASYLAVLLDSGSAPGDMNIYDLDGVMVTQGKLAVPFSPNIAEQVPGELPAASIPDAALPPDVALLDAPSDAFTGDMSAKSFTGSGSGLTNVPDAALSTNIPRLGAPSNAFTGDLTAKSYTGSGAGLTGIPDGALSSNIARLDAASNTFTGRLVAPNPVLGPRGAAGIAQDSGSCCSAGSAAVTSIDEIYADAFHTNGLSEGQLFLSGARIDGNATIAIGTGAGPSGFDQVEAVQTGGDLDVGGNASVAGGLSVTGNVTAYGVGVGDGNEIWENGNHTNLWLSWRGTGGVSTPMTTIIGDGQRHPVLTVNPDKSVALAGDLDVAGTVKGGSLDVSGATVTTGFNAKAGGFTLSGSVPNVELTLQLAKKYDQNTSDLVCWYRFALERPTSGGWHQVIIEDAAAGGGQVTHVQDGPSHWYTASAMAKLTTIPAGTRTIDFENQDTANQGDEIYDPQGMCFEVVR